MKNLTIACWILMAGLTLGVSLPVVASEKRETTAENQTAGQQKEAVLQQLAQSKNDRETTALTVPLYKPPRRGAPAGRVAGGTRGVGDELPFICVLAPDHTGLTVREQPQLYWFLSETTTYPIEFTLIESWGVKPLLETALDPSAKPGFQSVRLADYGIRLRSGVQYKWFVALVPDRDHRSRDIITAGEIERVELSEALRARLANADKMEAAYIYAEEGIWYDSLGSISELIEAAPQAAVLREQRASLLRQVGLPQIAQYDTEQLVPGGQ